MAFADRVVAGIKAAIGGAPVVQATATQAPWFTDSTLGIIGGWAGFDEVMGQSPAALWRSQPHLRTVVDFVARNIAQLNLHAFTRNADGGRERSLTDPAARLLSKPNEYTTGYELIRDTVSDLMLHDQALWQLVTAGQGQWSIIPIRASWIAGRRGGTAFQPEFWVIQPPGGKQLELRASECIHFHGWDPISVGSGTSPVETLKLILAEQISGQRFRQQVWDRGGRINLVLTRPADAPKWTKDQKDRFRRGWKSAWAGNAGSEAGGTPVLEDGMTAQRLGFSATDEQFVENNKLALSTVAGVYHVNPTMIGLLDNANYSNVREFRRMLYGDTLGPILAYLEARVNAFLLPMIGSGADVYVEFNIGEKLQGSFEEQAAVAQASIGAPFMTVNEYRAMRNLPAMEGGDVLLAPLNMSPAGAAFEAAPAADELAAPKQLELLVKLALQLAGAQPVHQLSIDAAPEVKAKRVPVSAPSPAHVKLAKRTLSVFFKRQRAAVVSALGSKAATPWWDAKRWDKELAADLFGLAQAVAGDVGKQTSAALGFGADDYDEPRTAKFLQAVAASRAAHINATTKAAVQAALNDDEDEEHTPDSVFDQAEDSRGDTTALTLVTTLTAFGTVEAGKQLARDTATKTWRVTSGNPRSSHAGMDGETVGIDDTFSNGMAWPGDPVNGPDDVAGCQCIIDISIPT